MYGVWSLLFNVSSSIAGSVQSELKTARDDIHMPLRKTLPLPNPFQSVRSTHLRQVVLLCTFFCIQLISRQSALLTRRTKRSIAETRERGRGNQIPLLNPWDNCFRTTVLQYTDLVNSAPPIRFQLLGGYTTLPAFVGPILRIRG